MKIKPEERDILLNEAQFIADDIISKRIITNTGCYWNTLRVKGGKRSYNVDESIYSGVSGIIIFLIDYYEITKDEKVKDTILEATTWLIEYCKSNKAINYSLFTGRMGAVYALIHNEKSFPSFIKKEDLEDIGRDCVDMLNQPNLKFELINGLSGCIMGLLHLHQFTQDTWVIQHVNMLVDLLVKSTGIDIYKGIFWDRDGHQIKPLCGFSHGVSGIAYTFLELGKYFNNAEYFHIAELAFDYENSNYNKGIKAWPDLRKIPRNENDLTKKCSMYMQGNEKYFLDENFFDAWCHGAPGIGLSRLRAFEILKKEKYLTDINRAYDRTKEISRNWNQSLTLCHGLFGNFLFLFKCDLQLGRNNNLREIIDFTIQSIVDRNRNNKRYLSGYGGASDDLSLFMGNSGIGYFYLQLLNTKNDLILRPDIRSINSTPDIQPDLSNKIQIIINSNYSSAKHIHKSLTTIPFTKVNILSMLRKTLLDVSKESKDIRKDLKIDTEKISLEKTMRSQSLVTMERITNKRKILQIFENNRNEIRHRIENYQVMVSKYQQIFEFEGDYYLVFITENATTQVIPLTFLNYSILKLLNKPKYPKMLVKDLQKYIKTDEDISGIVNEQIEINIHLGFIKVFEKSNELRNESFRKYNG